jgi:predicted site-specific integrase-resolvase
MNPVDAEKDFISIKEASIMTGIQPQTLRKLGDTQKIQCYRTHSGQRKFHRASLQAMCNHRGAAVVGAAAAANGAAAQNFIYVRVPPGSYDNGTVAMATAINYNPEVYKDYHQIIDVGYGTNYKRKGLQTILKACFQHTIGEIVILRRDDLAVVAYDLLEQIVLNSGGKIIVLTEIVNNFYFTETQKDNNIINELIQLMQGFVKTPVSQFLTNELEPLTPPRSVELIY